MFRTPRHHAARSAWFWVLILVLWTPDAPAQEPDGPSRDTAVAPASLAFKDRPIRPDSRRNPANPRGEAGSNWWFGPVGVAGALAVVGGISLASKRFGLNLNLGMTRDLGPIGLVGQTRLSPKHSVYLVRVGGRVLILGAGAGGSPTSLGEVTDPAELARLIPQRPARSAGPASTSAVRLAGTTRTMTTSTGFDQRIGDDE